jgi:hypothetical protein
MKIISCVLIPAMVVVMLLPLVIPPDVSAKSFHCLRIRDKTGDDDLWEKNGGEPGSIDQGRADGFEPVIVQDRTNADIAAVLSHRQRLQVWLLLTLRLVLSR